MIILNEIKSKEGGRNQNLKLFKRGKAMSGDLIKSGIIQFENPPINMGIIKKKIIRKAWEVIILLKTVGLNLLELKESSTRIKRLSLSPNKPDQTPNIK